MRIMLIILALMLFPVSATTAAQPSATPADDVAALLAELKRETDPLKAEKLRARLRRAWLKQGTASARLLLAEAARAQGDGLVETARRLLDLVARRWPGYVTGRFRRALLLWQRGNDKAALAELDAVLKRQPAYFPAAMVKMRLLEDRRDFPGALKLCRETLRRFPAWRTLRQRCIRLQWRVEQDA